MAQKDRSNGEKNGQFTKRPYNAFKRCKYKFT